MRVLRVLAPGHDVALTALVSDAVAAFNRGVDIRLRFLSIHIEETQVTVTEPDEAAELVNAAIDRDRPAVAILEGHGETALSAAAACVRRNVPLSRLGAGDRRGATADSARGIDRLASQLLVLDDEAAATLVEEALTSGVTSVQGDDVGSNVIKALRVLRTRRGGDAAC